MADQETVHVLGVSGSLRRGSYNTAALRAAIELAPPEMTIDTADISAIPLYNEDLRAEGTPEAVAEFRRRIAEADAVLIVTPEYNYSIPGVLKNALDWASRPPDAPFQGKPVAIMGASPGRIGTARAQYHLRQMFVFMRALVMPGPEVMIAGAASIFDESGRLTDAETGKRIRGLLDGLVGWTRALKRGGLAK